MNWTNRDRAIALSGIFQAVALVQQLAHKGQLDQHYFEKSIGSLFTIESENCETIFGGIVNLRLGLETLKFQMGGFTKSTNLEFTRYIISLIYLENRLTKSNNILEKMKTGIEEIKHAFDELKFPDKDVIDQVAELYINTLSNLQPRILVKGDHSYLTAAGNSEKIRALLFASVRACVLWRQLGGSRFELLFRRKKYLEETDKMLQQISQMVSS